MAKGRAGCDEIQKLLTTWPSWFFARGDLAAGGAGDESPLAFDDETLKVAPTHRFAYAIAARGGRGRGGPSTAGPQTVHLIFNDVAPGASAAPVIVWRNAAHRHAHVHRGPRRARGGRRRGGDTLPDVAGPDRCCPRAPLREMLSPEAAAALVVWHEPGRDRR